MNNAFQCSPRACQCERGTGYVPYPYPYPNPNSRARTLPFWGAMSFTRPKGPHKGRHVPRLAQERGEHEEGDDDAHARNPRSTDGLGTSPAANPNTPGSQCKVTSVPTAMSAQKPAIVQLPHVRRPMSRRVTSTRGIRTRVQCVVVTVSYIAAHATKGETLTGAGSIKCRANNSKEAITQSH